MRDEGGELSDLLYQSNVISAIIIRFKIIIIIIIIIGRYQSVSGRNFLVCCAIRVVIGRINF